MKNMNIGELLALTEIIAEFETNNSQRNSQPRIWNSLPDKFK